jgi:HEAT repeat protein
VFLDRAAEPEVRLGALSDLDLRDDGVMAKVIRGAREERKAELVAPVLKQLGDAVAADQVTPVGRALLIETLTRMLADPQLPLETHRATFEQLSRVGQPAEVVAGVLGYFHLEVSQPLEGDFLRHLGDTPEAAVAWTGNEDGAARTREQLMRLLPALAERRTDDVRAGSWWLFVKVAPPSTSLPVLAARYRAAQEEDVADVLTDFLKGLALSDLPEERARGDAVWQLAELLREPGAEDRVKEAAVAILDRAEVSALCETLFDVYFQGKGTKGTDGKGTAPDVKESAKVVLMPYAERTSAARVRGIQAHVLERLSVLAATRVNGRISTSDELTYLVQAVGLLRQRTGEPWSDGLKVLSSLLANHRELEDAVVRELLLRAITVLGSDGPVDLPKIREILQTERVPILVPAAAAEALGELHDAASVDALKAAAGDMKDRRLQIAALQALGRIGGDLRDKGESVGPIADYLQGVLERRGDQFDAPVIAEALKAFGEVMDPGRIRVVFDLLAVEVCCQPAMRAAQGLMLRGDDDCAAVVRAYLEWRTGKEDSVGKGNTVEPDELLRGGPPWPRTASEPERVMKRAAETLAAEAGANKRPKVREKAATLLEKLVPGAPGFRPEEGEKDREDQLKKWKAWWTSNSGRLHLGPNGLTPVPE